MEHAQSVTLPAPEPANTPNSPASSSATRSNAGRPQPLHPLSARQAEQALEDARAQAALANESSEPMSFELPARPSRDDSAELARRRREEQQAAARMAEDLLKRSGVPERYVNATLTEADALPVDAAGRWLDAGHELGHLLTSPAVALLLGPRGTGKTHLGCALVRDCCRLGRGGRYAKVMDYFGELKATFGKDSTKNERAVEREWVAPYLLVLDETQERHDSHFEQVNLTRLVDLRYDANKATVLITNQTLAEFQAANGTSIASRITDGGSVILCDWSSVRGNLVAPARESA